jgi:hypothetical protein
VFAPRTNWVAFVADIAHVKGEVPEQLALDGEVPVLHLSRAQVRVKRTWSLVAVRQRHQFERLPHPHARQVHPRQINALKSVPEILKMPTVPPTSAAVRPFAS